MSQMQVTVPKGFSAGQSIQVQTPAGQLLQVTIPAGVAEGQGFMISVPSTIPVATAVAQEPSTVKVEMPQRVSKGMMPPASKVAMGNGVQAFANFDDIYITQTPKGCFQEMMGCDANTEFLFGTRSKPPQSAPLGLNGPTGPPIYSLFYAIEDSSFCCRYCCSTARTSQLNMFTGIDENGSQVMSYDRPFKCYAGSCKCCCYQEMTFFDYDSQPIGSIKEQFYCCVPLFTIFDEAEQPQYRVMQPTCCGGACVDCCAEGLCNCRIPFYIYGPDGPLERTHELLGKTPSSEKGSRNGSMISQITKIWAGTFSEVLTDADKFDVEFPAGATPKQKGLLVGSVFFLNMLFFERNKNQEN